MTVARTARRRRIQSKMGYRHLARIGRGNNNRPYFSHHSKDTLDKREARARERRLALQARKGRKKA
jgi:hypothetical protein